MRTWWGYIGAFGGSRGKEKCIYIMISKFKESIEILKSSKTVNFKAGYILSLKFQYIISVNHWEIHLQPAYITKST